MTPKATDLSSRYFLSNAHGYTQIRLEARPERLQWMSATCFARSASMIHRLLFRRAMRLNLKCCISV